MDTQETRQDPVEMLIRYLTRGKDDLHVYTDRCKCVVALTTPLLCYIIQ